MNILYNDKTDILYLRFDERKQPVVNKRVTDDVVLDIGDNDTIIGVEIMDASKRLNLENLLPVHYHIGDKERLCVRDKK